jgi:hypothetical protein
MPPHLGNAGLVYHLSLLLESSLHQRESICGRRRLRQRHALKDPLTLLSRLKAHHHHERTGRDSASGCVRRPRDGTCHPNTSPTRSASKSST